MRLLGLDLGKKTLGIAITDSNKKIVNPLENFEYKGNNLMICVHRIMKIIKEYGDISQIVLGDPYFGNKNLNRNDDFIKFFNLLKANIDANINVVFADEFKTTKTSTSTLKELGLKGSQIKKIIDKVSAVEILNNYLMLNKTKITDF